jgi:hypothetical protein
MRLEDMSNVQYRVYVVFDRVFRGKVNWITPNVWDYGVTGNFYYELSHQSFTGDWDDLYGVTVIDKDENKRNDLSKAFSRLSEAQEYIESLA